MRTMSVIIEETAAQKKQEKKLIEKMMKKTSFSNIEIEKLLLAYHKIMVRESLNRKKLKIWAFGSTSADP